MHHQNCLYASLFALQVAALPANTFNTPCVPRYQIPGATPAAPPASSSIPQASTAPSSSGTIVPQDGGDREDNEESGGKSGDDNTSGGTATASTASTAATCTSNSTTAGSVGNTGGSETSSGFSSQNSSPPLQNTPRIQGLQPKLLLPATAVFMQTLRQVTARAVFLGAQNSYQAAASTYWNTAGLPGQCGTCWKLTDGTNINGDGSKGSLIGTAPILVMIDNTCAKTPRSQQAHQIASSVIRMRKTLSTSLVA
jgi:hypothetical protein